MNSDEPEPSWPLKGTATVLLALTGFSALLLGLGALSASGDDRPPLFAFLLFTGGECMGFGVLLSFVAAIAVTWLTDRRLKAKGHKSSAVPYQFGIRAVLAAGLFLAIVLAVQRSIFVFRGSEALQSTYRTAAAAAVFLACFFAWTTICGASVLAIGFAWQKGRKLLGFRNEASLYGRTPKPDDRVTPRDGDGQSEADDGRK